MSWFALTQSQNPCEARLAYRILPWVPWSKRQTLPPYAGDRVEHSKRREGPHACSRKWCQNTVRIDSAALRRLLGSVGGRLDWAASIPLRFVTGLVISPALGGVCEGKHGRSDPRSKPGPQPHQGRRVAAGFTRHGFQPGAVKLTDRTLRVNRPRVRTRSAQGAPSREVPIPAYEALRGRPDGGARMLDIPSSCWAVSKARGRPLRRGLSAGCLTPPMHQPDRSHATRRRGR